MIGTAGNKVLLDTVIVAGYFNQDHAILNKIPNMIVYVASITIGELYFGAYKSAQTEKDIQNIRRFSNISTVLICDENTADWYGQIKQKLQAKGRPIPENDIWIAAIAMQYQLIVATRDTHFKDIDNLLIEFW